MSQKIGMDTMDQRLKVILFLGAGASHFAGYHTFVGFPELLFNPELRAAEGMRQLSPNPERILMAIRNSLERNSQATTHDNFLWRLDGYTHFLRLNQSDEVLQEFLRDNARLYDLHICTEQAIHQICATTIHHYSANRVQRAKTSVGNTFANMGKVLTLYRDISALNGPRATLPIFTTNYDMLIEDLVGEFESQAGLPGVLVNGMVGLTQELETWRRKEYIDCTGTEPIFYLYRLHGCVCWFYHAQGDSGIYFHRRDATQQETDKLCAMYPGRETQIGMDPHGYSFRAFYEHLLVCNLVVFIGFSFRDDDVMHVLLKALAERRGDLIILVIYPLYTKLDVTRRLEKAAQRTGFPSRVPSKEEIDSLTMSFGSDADFSERILDRCKSLLSPSK